MSSVDNPEGRIFFQKELKISILSSLILLILALKISRDEHNRNILYRFGQDQIPGRGQRQRISLEPLGWNQSLSEYSSVEKVRTG